MAEKIELQYGYTEGLEEIVDVGFFQQLPERKLNAPVRFIPGKGIELAGPDPIEIGTVIISGTATATIAGLATIIKSWLASRRTRIELKNERTGKSFIYEGPKLSKKAREIASELSQLIDAEGTAVRIHASKRKPKKAIESNSS
ncbi:MAG TPA: hypothetical protein VF666_01710 [Pyrinomonadaceae bacterium]|jgi:hypothetical protein